MSTEDPMTPEAAALRHVLDAQRNSALEIIDGLTEEQLRAPVLPSGWTVLGMIEHLGHAERHWFQEVALGAAAELPWPAEERRDALTSDHAASEVIAFYRAQCERSNAVLATVTLDAPPVGAHVGWLGAEITDLRRIALHVIEETARHLGHLDAARELLDGRTGLGPRSEHPRVIAHVGPPHPGPRAGDAAPGLMARAPHRRRAVRPARRRGSRAPR